MTFTGFNSGVRGRRLAMQSAPMSFQEDRMRYLSLQPGAETAGNGVPSPASRLLGVTIPESPLVCAAEVIR